MRIALLALALLLAAAPAQAIGPGTTDPARMAAGTWVLDKAHSSVTVRTRHMGYANYTLRFDEFESTFAYDPKAPEATKVTASVDASSIDTGVPSYDTDFAEKFLGADKFPKITFASTAIKLGEGAHGTMTGDLTLRGVTKPVTFDVVFYGTGGDLNPLVKRAGFGARASIKRSDFGSTYLLDPPLAGDVIEIIVEAEFLRK